MDAVAARIGDLPVLEPRRKLRAVPEQLVRSAGNEHEGEPAEGLQQRLQVVASQREQMQQMEIELRAQIIAKAEIADMKKCFDTKVRELTKEQIPEKHDLQGIIEEKDRELIAVRRDNEVKQRQIIEWQKQYRVARETITSKDEQLRKAQEWLARIQAIDASQLATLQAELREHRADSGDFNALHSPTVQQSELRKQIDHQQALPEIPFHMDFQIGKTPMLDGADSNHFSGIGDDTSDLRENIRCEDITRDDIIGMEFDCFGEAETFYRRYAFALGFSIRKQDMRRNANGFVNMQKWVCSREGRRKQKFLERENKHRKPRPITRVGCPASFQVNMDNVGKWVVKQAILEHNHELDAIFLPDKALLKREKRSKALGSQEDVTD